MRVSMAAAIALTLAIGALGTGKAATAPLFAAAFRSFDTWRPTVSMAMGDLNGDGKPDLVVANAKSVVGCCTYNTVSVLLGNGDGTLDRREHLWTALTTV